MDASVVICTYNRAGLLRDALAALGAQRVPPSIRWEIVAVDNNSTDDTRAVIEAFRAGASVPTLHVFEARQGHTHARNAGLAAASGRTLLFTDDDCRPEPTWVQDVLEAMDRHGADGLGGRIVPLWSSEPPGWLRDERHLWDTLALLDDRAVRRVVLGGAWERENGLRVWGANMAFRRPVFDVVGGFDPALGPRGNRKFSHGDIEFLRRVLAAGLPVVFDPRPTVRHWVGGDRMRKAFFRRHAFFYGQGFALKQGGPRGRHLLGVPPYLLRAVAAHLATWAGAVRRRDPEAFCHQRQVLEDLGYLWGFATSCLRRGELGRLRPGPGRGHEATP